MVARQRGQGTNQEAVRRHNLGTVLRHVHSAGEISRAELTAAMGLNRSTIGALVAELELLGVTEQSVPSAERSGAGRPSAGVRATAQGPYVVALDVGVDVARVARIGLGGEVERHAQLHYGGATGPREVATATAGLVREVLADADPDAPLVGLGVAVPGLVRRSDGLVRLAPNLEWRDVPFQGMVQEALGLRLPIATANDADLGALAEHHRGAAIGIDDLIYLNGVVGVGAGILTGGQPLRGGGGYAGEIGHLSVDPDGLRCHCGNRGCWETQVGGEAIARALGLPAERVPQLIDVLLTLRGRHQELAATGQALGRGLANLVNAFNPRMVIVGGYLSSLHALCEDDVLAALAESALPAAHEGVSVVLPGLGRDSVLLGAAELALEPLFLDPETAIGSAPRGVGAQLAEVS